MNFRTLVGHCASGEITRRIGRKVTGLFSTSGWLRGVDLNPSPALIPRNLLILRPAKNAKTATTANSSFSFHSVATR